jgi:pyruvate/2-oxoglutarate dehydrogenase complex dihydrolipoamide acyltransferase (E2) component
MRPDNTIGDYKIERLAFSRRLAMDALSAVERGHFMLALLELDVTEAQEAIRRIQSNGTRVSLFAFLIRAIATVLAEHSDLNVIRYGRKIVRFADVDVNVPVELESEEGRFPHQVVIRRANGKTVAEIFGEIEAARRRYRGEGAAGEEDRWARRVARALAVFPRFVRVWMVKRLIRDPWTVKRRSGTTLVTSVGKFAAIPGFVVPFAGGPRATLFAVGSVVDKPAARSGHIVIRSFLGLTIAFDHDLVDGAPAARFARRLQALIETADGLAARPLGQQGAPGPRPPHPDAHGSS